MKAITIMQPWASLIAIGEKTFETRSWPTKHRGPIAIHAGKTIDKEACEDKEIKQALAKHGITSLNQLPKGVVVATAEIKECHKITNDLCELREAETHTGLQINGSEYFFGFYEEGRFAWELENVIKLSSPIPAKGQQRLWEWQP